MRSIRLNEFLQKITPSYTQTYLDVLLFKVMERDSAQVVVVRIILNNRELGIPESKEE